MYVKSRGAFRHCDQDGDKQMARRTKEEALETRNRILDAAEEVFQQAGVSRTALADIAAAAGVTRGAVYWHFESKAAVFDAMMQRVACPLESMLLDLGHGESDGATLERIRQAVVNLLQRVSGDEQVRRVFDIAWHKCEYVADTAEIRDRYLQVGRQHLEAMTAAFALVQREGRLAPGVVPALAARGLLALLEGLIGKWTLDPEAYPLAEEGTAIVEAYLRGVAG